MALEKKVAELTSHKDTAIEALRRESKSVHSVFSLVCLFLHVSSCRLLEESRSYISVLLSAMEGKGMVSSGEQNAALLTELRRLRSEVESRSKDSR